MLLLQRLTIRQRILLTFVAIALTGGALQFLVAGQQLRLATYEFYQHHLETDALMVATTLSEPLEHYLDGEGEEVQQALTRFQQEVGHDYLILDHAYQVLVSATSAGYERLDRVPETPELAAARQGQPGGNIRPDENGVDRLYVAVPVMYEQQIIAYLVLAEPMQPAYDEANQRGLELAGASLPVLALVVAASLWISGTISRPVQRLRDSALRMARGGLDTRISVQRQDEVGQLAQAFNYMAEQVENLMKAQRSFVSNAAHELRTPLMTLKLRAEALDDAALPVAERETYLGEIRQEVNHMAELVSSLLVLARIDEGRHERNGRLTDTVSALHDIVRHWRIEAAQAGLALKATIPTDLPDLPLSANDLRLVLDNLLNNAIKYTRQGSVAITAAQQGQQVMIQVRDSGVGFSPDHSERLFERFYRAETSHSRFYGNGLGLSIVKVVLELYNGTVEAYSPGPGQGATFTILLPITAQVVQPQPTPEPPGLPAVRGVSLR